MSIKYSSSIRRFDAFISNPWLGNNNKKVTQGCLAFFKVTAVAGANLASLPTQLVGLAAGAGVIAATKSLAVITCGRLISSQTCIEAGLTTTVVVGQVASLILFPLSLTSYGLSRGIGKPGALARSNLLISGAFHLHENVLHKKRYDSPVGEGSSRLHDAFRVTDFVDSGDALHNVDQVIRYLSFLINKGENVNAESEDGNLTVLHLLALWGIAPDAFKVIQFLVQNGANVNTVCEAEDDATVLHTLLEHMDGSQLEENLAVIQYIIENGGRCDALDNLKRTPLHYYYIHHFNKNYPYWEEIIKLLGPDDVPNMKDIYEKVPNYYASCECDPKLYHLAYGAEQISKAFENFGDLKKKQNEEIINLLNEQKRGKENLFNEWMKDWEKIENQWKEQWNERKNNNLDSQPKHDRKWCCKVLEIPESATKDEIKTAYKKWMLMLHPDKIVRKEEETSDDFEKRLADAKSKFFEIQTAFINLTDGEKIADLQM